MAVVVVLLKKLLTVASVGLLALILLSLLFVLLIASVSSAVFVLIDLCVQITLSSSIANFDFSLHSVKATRQLFAQP